MKKYVTFIGTLFILLLFFLIILFFNLNFWANHSFLKKKIINFLKANYNFNVDYEFVELFPFKKKLVLKRLYLENPEYFLTFSKAEINFSLVKLLHLNFLPSKVYFKDFYLKIPYFEKKEKKTLNLEDTLNYFYSLGPISVILEKGTIEKEVPYGVIKIDIPKGKVQIKENEIKGKLKSFISLNFQDKSFTLKESIKKIEGKVEVSGSTKEKDISIGVSSLEINFPKIYGKGEFQKNSQGYFLWFQLDKVEWLGLKKILNPFLGKDKTFKYLDALIKDGVALNSILKTSGKTFKELISLSNLHLETELKNGEMELKNISLNLNKIEGKLRLERAQLLFEGSAVVNEHIPFQIEKLFLDFNQTPWELFLKAFFESEPRFMIDVARSVIVKDWEVLREHQLEGKIKGTLELNGSLANLKPFLTLNFYELKIKTPFYLKPLLIKSGTLNYKSSLVTFKDLKLIFEDGWFENVEGSWELKNKFLNLQVDKAWIGKNFIKDLKEINSKIDEFISKYNITFDGIFIDWLNYKGRFSPEIIKENPQTLSENLTFKGKIINSNLEVSYKEEKFLLESQRINFVYEKGKVILEDSLVYIDKLPFEINGVYFSDFWSLKLKGEVKEALRNKIVKLAGWNESLILKDPVILNNFEIENFKNNLVFKGEGVFSGKFLSFIGNYTEGNYIFAFHFKSKNSDFNFSFKKGKAYELEMEGDLELSELSSLLFNEKRILEGKVRAQLYTSFLEKDIEALKKNLENKNFKELIQNYLISEFFPKMGHVEVEKFRYVEKGNLLELSSQLFVYPSEINLENLNLKWNNLTLNGKVKILKENQFLHLKGFLETQKVDLRSSQISELKPEKEEFTWEEEIFKLPLIVDLEINLKDIILPTAHLISESKAFLLLNSEKVLTLKIPVIDICGLKIEGFYEKNPELQYIFMELLPSSGDFLDLFSCLYPNEMPKIILEGPFKTKGFFYTDGKKILLEETYGELEVISSRGYIYRAPLIAKVLGFLSPIDIFRGKVPNLENNLLEYEELKLIGYFENTSFKINEGFLSALGFRLFTSGSVSLLDRKTNLTFYISPFKTVDTIIEKISFLRERLLGKPRMLIFVPLQVVGTYDNPIIVPLHPSSIGKGIFTFFFRFLGIDEAFYKAPQVPEKLKKLEIFKDKVENNLRR